MLKFNRLIYCALLILAGCADHEYQQYQGQQQNWPTAPGAFVEMKDGVPVYYGYPPRPYVVLGRPEIPMDERPSYLRSRLIALKKFSAQGGDAS
jgi:hypothetical protein